MSAPTFDEMVRDRAKITLGEAKKYANTIPEGKRGGFTGCYTVRSPSCPGCCLALACPLNLGCCLWYNTFMCACKDDAPAAYSCTDGKGISYYLVKVDAEKGTLAWFSHTDMHDDLKAGCFCERVC
jgi:hypothetical protein